MPTGATTPQALIDHWEWAAANDKINAGTATALATACRRVLAAQDSWHQLNVRTLPVDDIVRDFTNAMSGELKPSSLRDYGQKFRRAVAAYLNYLDNPDSWDYPSRASGRRQYTPPSTVRPNPAEAPRNDIQDVFTDSPQEYRYPFRPGFLARLVIPQDATEAEIGRLAAWVRTLAVDYKPEH